MFKPWFSDTWIKTSWPEHWNLDTLKPQNLGNLNDLKLRKPIKTIHSEFKKKKLKHWYIETSKSNLWSLKTLEPNNLETLKNSEVWFIGVLKRPNPETLITWNLKKTEPRNLKT
jgi:hypothetical protein